MISYLVGVCVVLSVPALSVTVVQGTDALLPCDVNDRRHDHVNMVLWFKDQSGVPLYR